MLMDAQRICTAPTVGKSTFISLTNVLRAARDTSCNGCTTVDAVAGNLGTVNVRTVLIPALNAVVAKGHLAWNGTDTLRVL